MGGDRIAGCARAQRPQKAVLAKELFGATAQLAGGGRVIPGRSSLSARAAHGLAAPLEARLQPYNERDGAFVERWAQDVYFQFFSCQLYFERRMPCDATADRVLRLVLGKAGEQLLKTTIEPAVAIGAVKKAEFERGSSTRQCRRRR